MFLVNSRFPLVSAAHTRSGKQVSLTRQAPLLPKLRGHFAEFLNHDSLDRLGILYQITCVGLGYGRTGTSRRCFSRQHRITESPTKVGAYQVSGTRSADLPTKHPTPLDQVNSIAWLGYLPASHLLTR